MHRTTKKKTRWLLPLLLVAVLVAAVALLSALKDTKKPAEPAPTALPTAVPAEETAPVPTEAPTPVPPTPAPTAAPTEAPTDTPAPTATPEPTETPEPEPTKAPVESLQGGVGTYTWKNGGEEWTLTLRDNGTYTIRDGAGQLHTGESWAVEENGTVTCGPTTLFGVDFSFSGGCSLWRFLPGGLCEPVYP